MTKTIADTGMDRDEALTLALKAPSKMYAWVLRDLLTELQQRRSVGDPNDTQTEPEPGSDGELAVQCLDQLTDLLNRSEWNADLMEPVFHLIRQSGRTIEDTDTQTEPARALPKPGTEIRADELNELRGVSIEHPDTGELFTVAKVAWHGDTILLTDYEGSETDLDRDSGVMVVAACPVCEHEIAEDFGLCPGCLHNAKRSGWTPGDPMSDFTGGA